MRTLLVLLAALLLTACPGVKSCPPGSNACACTENVCDTGLVCLPNNTCGAAVAAGLGVSDAAARGCEVLLTEQAGTTVAAVIFGDGVVGTFVREAPKVAVSFVASADAQLPAAGISLALSGPASGLVVSKAACVDAKGAKLPAASVSLR
jgi:hypothetical protein